MNPEETSNKKTQIILIPTYTPTGMSIKKHFLEEWEDLLKSHNAKNVIYLKTALIATLEKEKMV